MSVEIIQMHPAELETVADVLGEAFAPLPSTISIFRGAPHLDRRMGLIFKAVISRMPGETFVAKDGDMVLGAMRMVQWPDCQMKPAQAVGMLPQMIKAAGIRSLPRAMKMRNTWAKRDPRKEHWHLDPLGVLPAAHGKGIGSRLMEYYCKRVDESASAAYHETDKEANVRFYEKFGFKVVGEEKIFDFNIWYLYREPTGCVF